MNEKLVTGKVELTTLYSAFASYLTEMNVHSLGRWDTLPVIEIDGLIDFHWQKLRGHIDDLEGLRIDDSQNEPDATEQKDATQPEWGYASAEQVIEIMCEEQEDVAPPEWGYGWVCPICGRVWSVDFEGPCVCHQFKHDTYRTASTND